MRLSPEAHILVVATRDLQKPIGESLRHGGYGLSYAHSCLDAIQAFAHSPPDIVVLHAPLSGGRAAVSLAQAAELRGIPVLTVGHPDGHDEPGPLRRDLNRVNALVASHLANCSPTEQLVVGEVTVDTPQHVACVGDKPLDLTQKEFELLRHLMRRPGWAWTRQQLLEQVWGYDLTDPRVVTVHIGNLRKKLWDAVPESRTTAGAQPVPRQAFIQTVRGVGYRFARPERAGDAREEGTTMADSRPPVGHSHRSPFVGREPEMAVLRESLEEALGGHVQTAVLVGDAGIGKTRLAEEFSSHAGRLGVTVHWGRCHDRPVGPAYWAWMEIFDQWERASPAGNLAALFWQRSPDSGLTHRKGQRARFLFLEKLTAVVQERAEKAPACLVLENLHWADTSTLLALQHVVRHLREVPLMLVLTYRPFEGGAHPRLTDIVAEIASNESGSIIALSPLTPPEVERFVSEFGQASATTRDIDGLSPDIYELTEGNPLFLTQLMRLLLLRPEHSEVRIADLDLGREEGVRSVILQRLSRISSACREWLDMAAVFGREFTGSLVGESIGLSPELLPGIVTEAAEARLVSARDDAPERYRFSHTLIREVLYDELPSERRAGLHSRAGAALERQCADELDLHSSALAHHYSSAASTGSVQKAVEYCVRAGRVAASQYAWEEACGHWQRGLAMLELLPVDAAERCPPFVGRIYEDLGDGYGLIGDADRAIEAYEHAARHLPREDNVCLARVTRKQVDHLYNRVRHGQALAVVSQASALLGTPSEGAGCDWWQEWIEVQLSRARLHFWSGETDDARMLVEAMEPSVTSQGTQTQHADCALLKWLVHLRQRRFVADAQTVKSAEVCAKRFVALGSATDLQDAQMVLGVCYLHSPARRGRAREHLVCYLELARQNHDVLNQITALEALSVWHRWRGEVEQVRSYASGVLALAKDRQIVRHLPEARGDLAWAAWRTGQAEEARALATAGLEELERAFPRSAFEWRVRWPLFGLSHVAGDLDEAALQARAIRDPLQSKMPHDLDTLSGRFVEQHSRGIPETEGTAHALAIAARTLGYL